jgi:hypothetical protein
MAHVIVPRVSLERLATSKPWLRGLPGGLPSDFDYRVLRSVVDARAMMFELPGCDRAKAAVELYRHRGVVGMHVAYIGIMRAWTFDSRQVLEAFGSADRFIRVLRNVGPPVQLPPAKPIQIWRGTLVNRTAAITVAIGLSWTRSRNAACWFALHEYVPPSSLHSHLSCSMPISIDRPSLHKIMRARNRK